MKNINKTIFEYFNNIVLQMENLEKHIIMDKNVNITTEFGILENKYHIGIIPIILLLISKTKISKTKYQCYHFNPYNSIIVHTDINKINSNLIVIPDHLIHKWHQTLGKINLKYYIIDINTKISNLDSYIIKQYDVILCVSSKYNNFINYMNVVWDRIIIDKTDIINKCNVHPKFKFLWLICSDISKSKSWIKSYLDTIKYNKFFEYITIPTDNQIIINTIQFKINIFENCYKKLIINNFHGYNSDKHSILLNIQKLLNIHNPEIVIKLLNGSIYNNKNDLPLSKLSTKREIDQIDTNNCYICMDDINIPIIISCCVNTMCFNCFINLIFKDNISKINFICPLCRQDFDFKDIIMIKDNYKYSETITYLSNMNSIVNKYKDKKILILDINDLTNLKELLKKEQLKYIEIKGNCRNISNILFKYNTTTSILIINNIIHIHYLYDIYDTDVFIYDSSVNNELIEIIINKISHYKRNISKPLDIYKLTGI